MSVFSRPLAIVFGVQMLLAYWALSLAGGGHGWNSAFNISLIAVVISAIAAGLEFMFEAWRKWVTFISLGANIILSVMLFDETLKEGIQYFYSTAPYCYGWIVLWTLAQILLISGLRSSKS